MLPHIQHPSDLPGLVEHLFLHPETQELAAEVQVLQSIYGEDAIEPWDHTDSTTISSQSASTSSSNAVRLQFHLNLPTYEVPVSILVSLPESYPASSPPQLQLLSRYIGSFSADSQLFGSVLRTYISASGVEWTPGNICIFDGLQNAIDTCTAWYQEQLSKKEAGELVREDLRGHEDPQNATVIQESRNDVTVAAPINAQLPEGIEIIESEAIVDRKSTFIGRACRISHPSQVSLVLDYLMTDRRISRATHPKINAWRCQVSSVIHQGNDDDGETAAGGRLAHLLQILELQNVLVVVTRYFGGIQLGPDRFKHINQAARTALELGGFLDQALPNSRSAKKAPSRGKKK